MPLDEIKVDLPYKLWVPLYEHYGMFGYPAHTNWYKLNQFIVPVNEWISISRRLWNTSTQWHKIYTWTADPKGDGSPWLEGVMSLPLGYPMVINIL